MGAPRPRTSDVVRRLAAAITVAGAIFLALVAGAGAASAGAQPLIGSTHGAALAAAPAPGVLQAAGDLSLATVPASSRHQGDPDTGWAEPARAGVLLAAAVAFFVGLRDTSRAQPSGRSVPQLRGRSPPRPAALAAHR